MGFLRRNDGLDGARSLTRQKPLATGDDFWIEPGGTPRALEVEVASGEHDALTVAVTVCIDGMALATAAGRLSRLDSR